MQLLQPTQNHESYSFDVLFYQGINRIFQVVVEVVLAVLHNDAELVVFDLVVVDADDLVTLAYIFVLDQLEVLNLSDEVLLVLGARNHLLHSVDLASSAKATCPRVAHFVHRSEVAF